MNLVGDRSFIFFCDMRLFYFLQSDMISPNGLIKETGISPESSNQIQLEIQIWKKQTYMSSSVILSFCLKMKFEVKDENSPFGPKKWSTLKIPILGLEYLVYSF